MSEHLLAGLRVLDLTQGLSGAYCTKLFADAWADVLVLNHAGDHHPEEPDEGATLWRYLHASKRTVGGDPAAVTRLAAEADLVVEDRGRRVVDPIDIAALRRTHPGLVVVSLSPFGHHGPWADRPATEFTLQAWCGALAKRGTPERPPLHAGGRIGEWTAGSYAAAAGLAAVREAARSGRGEHVDVSILEVMALSMVSYDPLLASLGGPAPAGPPRSIEVPGVEPSADGYVGFTTTTPAQFRTLLDLIGRPDLADDERLASAATRFEHREWFQGLLRAWTTRRTTDEILEAAGELRIPVAPVCDGASVVEVEHFRQRGVFVPGADGTPQPRVPYRIGDVAPRPFTPTSPAHEPPWSARAVRGSAQPRARLDEGPGEPLAGLRVLDFTAFWAGPVATQLFAALGADVVKVESRRRIDGMRLTGVNPGLDQPAERGHVFHGANTGKRSVTLDLPDEVGRARALIAEADVVIENFTPRVMDRFGLDWPEVHRLNPTTIMVRLPAYGLDGPWRDRPGFAQNMEHVAGMAFRTGYADGPPVNPRGPCDPIGGVHAAFATLVALAERDRTGVGTLVEAPMVEAVLNVAAEPVLTYAAEGRLLGREGNRGPRAAPQGVYPCRGEEQWLALAVATDEQWAALTEVLGRPGWARDPALAEAAGRRAAHDRIDAELAAWTRDADLDEVVERLAAAGVPAAAVVPSREVTDNPQLVARGFFERLTHPVIGTHPFPGQPFRFASRTSGWLRRPAPLLGEHDAEVLGGVLGEGEGRS